MPVKLYLDRAFLLKVENGFIDGERKQPFTFRLITSWSLWQKARLQVKCLKAGVWTAAEL